MMLDTEKRATGRKDVRMLMGHGAKHVEMGEGTGHTVRTEPRAARGRSPRSKTRRWADHPESMHRSRTVLRDELDQQDPSFFKGLTTAVLVDSTPRRCERCPWQRRRHVQRERR